MGADVEVEPGPVLQEDVRGTAPRDDPTEQVTGDLVRRQPALTPERAGNAVLVLGPEYPPFHPTRISRWPRNLSFRGSRSPSGSPTPDRPAPRSPRPSARPTPPPPQWLRRPAARRGATAPAAGLRW